MKALRFTEPSKVDGCIVADELITTSPLDEFNTGVKSVIEGKAIKAKYIP